MFEKIKQAAKILQPSRPIQTSKTINTDDIEQSANQTIQAEGMEARAANAKMSDSQDIENSLTKIARAGTEAYQNYMDTAIKTSHNANVTAMTQAKHSAKLAQNMIKGTNNPTEIQQYLGQYSAQSAAFEKQINESNMTDQDKKNAIENSRFYNELVTQKGSIKLHDITFNQTVNTLSQGADNDVKFFGQKIHYKP